MSATSAHPVLTLASLLQGVSVLAARDRRFARIVADYGPPPLWARPQGFTTLTRIILEQQVSLASAAALVEINGGAAVVALVPRAAERDWKQTSKA
jgi:DNA-3-methyladenine glycosylase II